jgi:peptidoglycan/LPS O-acetylase OafA/YrhL
MEKLFYNKPIFTESTWALLAGARFFLALIVIVGHLKDFVVGFDWVLFIASFGPKAAVMSFLLISGISIGYSYRKNKSGFFKRRFLRIYPLYFFAVLFAVFLQYYLGSPYKLVNTTMVAAGYFTSLANFLVLGGIASIIIPYNGPLWSLGVEVFLYLTVPLLMYLRLRYTLLISLISMFFFTFINYNFLYGYLNLLWAWPFIIGLIVSAKQKPLFTIPLLILSFIIVFYKKEIFGESLSVLIVSLSLIICFMAMYMNVNLSKNTIRVFNFLGTISYPLYLLLYHSGVKDAYVLMGLVILLCIPINYIFDVWLKNIFWNPLVANIESALNFIVVKLKDINLIKT